MAEIPHPEVKYKDQDAFKASFKDACRSCHFGNYAKYLDSVHYRLLTTENAPAPGCIDCHDSHAITPPGKPRTRISDTCAGCHSDIQETYLKSVHGQGLAGANGADVPVCTDCHRSHDIENPKEAAFLLRTPQLCGSCHADKKRMEKYGLSTNVLATYLQDFHGMTASLSKDTTKGEARVTAVCVDCHGVHDIARVKDPSSKVLKANLVKTCQKCHKDASDNFPTAWLSHFEPSWQKAPLVYLMKRFYTVFIPFVIGGLCLQILLHLWRVVVNR
jgi:predicted CXXCH cytochrome family protein